MTADELKKLAIEYVKENQPDTVEITSFVEWAYRREGKKLGNMSLLEEIEGGS